MKISPAIEYAEDYRLDDSTKGRQAVDDVLKAVRDDETDMVREWSYQQKMWARYYSMVNRDVNFPYPGAANIVDPLSYKHGSKLQPILLNLLTGGSRWVAARPRSAMAYKNKPNIEILMEGMLRGGSRHSMPDFEDQVSYALENYCWAGKGVFASFWDFQTRIVSYTIRRDALPGLLSLLVIRNDITPAEIARLNRTNPQALMAMNGPEVQNWLGKVGIIQPIIPSRDWSVAGPVIRKEVVRVFGLDEEDKSDQKAIKEVMLWLRSGTKEKQLTIKIRKVLRDSPNIAAISPFDIIVPAGGMNDCSQLDRISQKLYLSKSEVYRMAEDHKWDKEELDKAMEGGARTALTMTNAIVSYDPWRQETRRRMGLLDRGDIFELRKTYALVDIYGTKEPEQIEILWEPNSGAILRSGAYCARHGKLPYVVIPFEYSHPAYTASRGLPKILEDAELYNTGILRHTLNNAQSGSCTMFSARRSQWLDPETITPMPNLVVEVEQQGDFQQIPLTTNTMPLERVGQMLQTWPEEIVGTLDVGATQNPRLFEPRTRFEVERITSSQQGVIGKRGKLFLKRMGQLYSMSLSLWQQYGPEEVYIDITGDQPMYLNQADTMGECDVIPVAAVGEMDPQFRYQKAQQRVQMAIAAQPYFQNDPERVLDIPALVEDAFNEDDPMAAKRAIRRLPQDAVQQNLQRIQQQADQAAKYADVAQRLMAGAPVGVDEMKEVIQATGKIAAMGKLQPLVDNAAQAQSAINRVAAEGQQGQAQQPTGQGAAPR